MPRNTLIGKLSQKKFVLRYFILNFMTVIFIGLTLLDLPGILLVIASLFAPMVLLVYEAIITVGRLHDLDQSVSFVFVLYFKYELVKRLFYGQNDIFLIISILVYIGFVLFLMTKSQKRKI